MTVLAPSGPAGSVDIRVTTPGGTSQISASDEYTYTNVLYAVPAGTGTLCTLTSPCSLGYALEDAGSGYTIYLASPGTYVGNFVITTPVTIEPLSSTNGAYWIQANSGNDAIQLNYNGAFTGTTTIDDVTITGKARGIENDFGTLDLNNCVITSNNTGSGGGGIYNLGTMALNNCTISGNTAYGFDFPGGGGGGIENSGTMSISDSTISDNTAHNSGGGGVDNVGTMTMTNTTVTGNAAAGGGGGISNTGGGTLTFVSSTSASNTHQGNGADGLESSGTIYVAASILADTCQGNIIDAGYNASVVSNGCPDSATGDLTFSTSQLGPLANNGGLTQTMRPAGGSPVIGAISPTSLAIDGANYSICPTTDQRGDPSPSGGPCDIGSVQTGGSPPPLSITQITTSTNGSCPATGPNWGPIAGGSTVCITGTGFTGANSVKFQSLLGGVSSPATSFNVDSLSQITAIAPACPGQCSGPTYAQITVSSPTSSKSFFFGFIYLPNNLVWYVSSTSTTGCLPVWSGNSVSNPCSLSSALSVAAPGNIIELISGSSSPYTGSYTLDTPGTSQADPLTIEPGQGVSDPTFSNNFSGSAFTASNGGFYVITGVSSDKNLSGITIGNCSSGNGGGINAGNSNLTVSDVTFSGNRATYGGAIDVNGGSLQVSNSTFSDNTASYGGAIDNYDNTNNSGLVGSINISNSTFFEDTASDDGGAIYNPVGTTDVIESTFVANSTSPKTGTQVTSGATIFNGTSGSVEVAADILDGSCNQGTTWQDNGYNVSTDATCEGASVETDGSTMSQTGELDSALLTNNGGPTETIALLPGNPAVGLIPPHVNPYCPDTGVLDQRGIGNSPGQPCDAGAVQLSLPPRIWYVSAHNTRVPVTCVANQAGSSSASPCGLTSALLVANAGDTIALVTPGSTTVADGEYSGNFTLDTPGTSKEHPLTIEPAGGVADPIIKSGGNGAILTIGNGGFYTLTGVATDGTQSGITIQGGNGQFGGAISNDNQGTFDVNDITLSNNAGKDGGAINNIGSVNVSNSTFLNNSASDSGGAIDSFGALVVSNSTFSNNSAVNDGGAITNPAGATSVFSSTFVSNVGKYGDDIENGGSVTVEADVFGDSCAQLGGTWTDNGYNAGTDSSCENAKVTTDNSNMAATQLGALASNGGPTQTVVLEKGNPAAGLVPSGTATYCPASGVTDQRGVVGSSGQACDAGAVQLVVAPPTITMITPSQGPAAGGTDVTITGTGFSCGASCVPVVKFGTSLGTSVSVVSDTSLTVSSPADSGSPGTVDVRITNSDGITSATSSADQFIYTPDEQAYVANAQSNTVSVVDTITKQSVKTIEVGNTPMAVVITPNHKWAYVVNNNPASASSANAGNFTTGSVSVINTATNTVSTTIQVGMNPVAIAITPDGSKIFVVNSYSQKAQLDPTSTTGTISVISTSTNTVTATINTGFDPFGIAISPDGTKAFILNDVDLANLNVSSGSSTPSLVGDVTIIDTSNYVETPPIDVGMGPDAIAISPDGSSAYVANSQDNTVSVINVATKSVSSTISVGHVPDAIAFSPDGKTVYVGNSDLTCTQATPAVCTYGNSGSVSVISTSSGTVTDTLPMGNSATKNEGAPSAIAIAPDGSVYVSNGAFNTVSEISPSNNQVTMNSIFVGLAPSAIAMLPAANQPSYPHTNLAYVTNFDDNTISVVDTATNEVLSSIGVGSGPDGVAVTPDGSKAYVANFDANTVSVVDTVVGAVSSTISVGQGPSAVAISPDGSRAYVANFTDGTVSVINTSSDTVTSTINVELDPLAIAISPDGTKVYVANSGSGTVSVIDTGNDSVTAGNIAVGSGPSALAIAPDGSKVYVANYNDGTVSVIDTSLGTVSATFNVETHPMAVAITPDGKQVYVADFGTNTIAVEQTDSTSSPPQIVQVGNAPDAIVFSQNGSEAFVANYNDGTVSVVSVSTDSISSTVDVGKGPSAVALVESALSVPAAHSKTSKKGAR